MQDRLPFPDINARNTEEQVSQIVNYLILLKEEMEFILGSISVDNLSPELVEKLNEMGADIEKSNETSEDHIQQLTNKALTVSDVINSDAFDSAVKGTVADIEFTVNFETGNLEYE